LFATADGPTPTCRCCCCCIPCLVLTLPAAATICSHLLEHEDNEMMRPYCVGNPGYINPHTGKPMCA
jgi:hypothetical protein